MQSEGLGCKYLEPIIIEWLFALRIFIQSKFIFGLQTAMGLASKVSGRQ